MRYFLSLLFIFASSTILRATEFRVLDGEIDFAKVRVVVNSYPIFFWNVSQGDAFYNAAVSVGSNTVTRNYPTPSSDEINLSTCALRYESWEDFKQAKKGYLNKKIRVLKDNDDDLIIPDVDARINWLKEYRAENR